MEILGELLGLLLWVASIIKGIFVFLWSATGIANLIERDPDNPIINNDPLGE